MITDAPPYRLIAEPTAPLIPGRRQVFTDPNFCTPLVRVTGEIDGTFNGISYGIWSPFSCDYRTMLVQCDALFKLVTWNPNTMDGWGEIPLPPSFQGVDAIFSHSDPAVIYHRDGGSRLLALNIDTGADSVVLDAAADFPDSPFLTRMSGTLDDRTFCFARQTTDYGWSGFCVYRDGKVIFREPPGRAGKYFKVQIDKTGGLVWNVSLDPKSEFWDLSLPNTQTPVLGDGTGHSAVLCGALAQYDNTLNQDMLRRGGKREGQVMTIAWPDWELATEYSGSDHDEWYAVTTGTLNPVGPLHDELIQVATDGSGTVRRLAHLHNVMVSGDYDSIPKPACGYGSASSPWIAFNSSWGKSGRRDAFVASALSPLFPRRGPGRRPPVRIRPRGPTAPAFREM